jgi:hypothetical protein
MHCAEVDDCESIDDNPVCQHCFDDLYNDDYTLRGATS